LTADTGTVPQLAKDAAAAWTFRVHILPPAPPDVVQLIVAAEFPDTVPRSGSVAVNLIVPGLAEMALIVVPPAFGKSLLGTTTLGFF
jgi:hypothetical protein